MSQWVTDTHGLLWHLYNANKLSAQVKEIFARADSGEHQIVIPAIVPDMPDRVIAATALHLDLPLLTRDGRIQKLSNVRTVW